ncbi:efflux RND transporter periplasmic adaptor subunit [Aegicerativicinus sediminis]|uniref:efflux RND transporter periplasmic adaptor subunit n=1 Tax=Aegicerativicinus sediminis TaxID=2893202 RepID=UPI001E2D0424|nr:efflux RND transporter periplasmic adaptor subunit [Aegicerativicinus sediminis]
MFKKIDTWKITLLYSIMTITIISCTKSRGENLEANNTSIEVNKLPVDVIQAKQTDLIQEEQIVGTILPIQEVAIVSEVSQKITKIAFRDGDYVSRGQLLYKLNDTDLRAKQKELYAELKLAQLNEQRYASLLKTEAIRQQDYDEVESKLNSLKAQIEFLDFQLTKTELRAPFSGRIGISKVDLGAFVYPGLELVNLQDQSKVLINFSVPEKHVLQVQQGKSISFTTQVSNELHEAKIISSNSGLDNQNRSLLVQAIADNEKHEFKGGMSAKINFSTLEEGTKGVKIPSQALIPSEQGYSVFLLEDDKAKLTAVEITNRSENEVTILTGINNGDKVIVSNILRLGDGLPVYDVTTTN